MTTPATPDDSEAEASSSADQFFRTCLNVLAPLFDATRLAGVERIFEYACCLVRAGGIEARDSDPILESTALLEDLGKLSMQPLDPQQFEHPERTRARLALISYCHTTEADFFYRILATLAKVHGGDKYDMSVFRGLGQQRKNRTIPPSPSAKIERVNALCSSAGVDTKPLFNEIYVPEIRNALFHADYALSDSELRIFGGWYKTRTGLRTRVVPFDELGSLIQRSFAFYSAVLSLHRTARQQLIEFKDKLLPYDWHYKGLLEFLFEEDLLAGFRTYWPNGSISEFSRLHKGSSALNIEFDDDGSINFMVGLYAARGRRSEFSPLVEEGHSPIYRPAAGRTIVPHWPEDLKPFSAI